MAIEPIEVEILDLARGGAGVAREASGRVIFVPYTAPGDRVRIEVVDEDERYAQGRLLEVITPSPERVQAPCPVFTRCGGCEWQHLPYPNQWARKRDGVLHALKRAGVEESHVPKIEEFPAGRALGYRSRIQLHGRKGVGVGFYAPRSKTIVPIQRCEIAREELNALIPGLESRATTPEFKVELDWNGETREAWNSRHAALGFSQVNPEENERLKHWISEAYVEPSGQTLLDLFGGSGNLSFPIAERYRSTYCVDLWVPPHGTPAPAGLTWFRSAIAAWCSRAKAAEVSPAGADAILDPPREGLGRDFHEIETGLKRLGVRRVILVGCDVDSWVRDVRRFGDRGWKLDRVALFDFFPQTHHVESVALLSIPTL